MARALQLDAQAARSRPPSVHFVNNVLAAAAGAIEDDPALARDTLAHLGAYLSARLRDPAPPVDLADELDLVESYLVLEQARFPGRVHAQVSHGDLPALQVAGGSLQATVQDHLARRLDERPAACRVAVRVSGSTLVLDLSDFPGGDEPVRTRLELA